jgi:hypothetical protein
MNRTHFLATLALLATLVAAGQARAGSTDPKLALGTATIHGDSDAAQLELTGIWHFDDILQVDFPLTVVVSQGSTFALHPAGPAAGSGSAAALTDGLQIADIATVEAAASPAPDAAVVLLEPHRMRLLLPAVFAGGTLRVRLYVELPLEGSFLSNELTVNLPSGGGA